MPFITLWLGGNRHGSIFEDKTDYEYMLSLLSYLKDKIEYELRSYCLMTNHFHLLLETGDEPVWNLMKPFMQQYTGYYNSKYGLDGHLFQGRYRAILVQNDSYFLQTSRYIHLNPVKAKMVNYPDEYDYSSYKTLIGMDANKLVGTSKIWSYFPHPQNQSYRTFVEENSKLTATYEQEIRESMKEDELWLPW